MPARLEGERRKARLAGMGELDKAGPKTSLEGSNNKGAGEADNIFTVSKFLTVLKVFNL